MIPAKPLDRAISDKKIPTSKYYVRMSLTPSPQSKSMQRFFQPSPPILSRDPYVINE